MAIKSININSLSDLSESGQQLHGARQLPHMMDQPVRFQLCDWHLGIAKADADHRNSGAAGDPDVVAGIADHDARGDRAGGRGLPNMPAQRLQDSVLWEWMS